jgi:hypothetical protein
MFTDKEITWLFKELGLSDEKERKRIASLGDKYRLHTVKKPKSIVKNPARPMKIVADNVTHLKEEQCQSKT